MTDQPTPPAGWYADPGGSGDLRWWDGAAWTPHTHADPAAPAAPAAPATPPSAPSPSPAPGAGPGPGDEVPWWAQTNDGRPPSWWAEGTPGPSESPGAPVSGPYAHTRAPVPMARAEGAVRALVLGIVSLICCGIILGPIAIYEGSQVRYRVRASNGRLDGDGFGIAAMVLGAVATLFSLIGIYLAATGRSPFLTNNTGR